MAKKKTRNSKRPKNPSKKEYADEELIDYSVFDHITKKKDKVQLQSNSSSSNTIIYVSLILFIIFVGLLASGVLNSNINNNNNNQNDNNINQPTNGIITPLTELCVDHTAIDVHNHFGLKIFINNQLRTIPANVGVSEGCMRPLHTHKSDNVVHNEMSNSYNGPAPTLADFFTIWGKSFSSSELLGLTGNITMEINGEIKEQANPQYVLINGDQIQLNLVS